MTHVNDKLPEWLQKEKENYGYFWGCSQSFSVGFNYAFQVLTKPENLQKLEYVECLLTSETFFQQKVDELLEKNTKQKEQITMLKEALKIYGDRSRWDVITLEYGNVFDLEDGNDIEVFNSPVGHGYFLANKVIKECE